MQWVSVTQVTANLPMTCHVAHQHIMRIPRDDSDASGLRCTANTKTKEMQGSPMSIRQTDSETKRNKSKTQYNTIPVLIYESRSSETKADESRYKPVGRKHEYNLKWSKYTRDWSGTHTEYRLRSLRHGGRKHAVVSTQSACSKVVSNSIGCRLKA